MEITKDNKVEKKTLFSNTFDFWTIS